MGGRERKEKERRQRAEGSWPREWSSIETATQFTTPFLGSSRL